MKSKTIFFSLGALLLGLLMAWWGYHRWTHGGAEGYVDPAKVAMFERDSDAFAERIAPRSENADWQMDPPEWSQILGGPALASKVSVAHSRSVIVQRMKVIEQHQQMYLAYVSGAEKYMREYGLHPADFNTANANWQRGLANGPALSNEVRSARLALYGAALEVLTFVQQQPGQFRLQDGQYGFAKPEDQSEFMRLLRLVADASDWEGAAVDRYNTHRKTQADAAVKTTPP